MGLGRKCSQFSHRRPICPIQYHWFSYEKENFIKQGVEVPLGREEKLFRLVKNPPFPPLIP